jgi:hypothetical protein
VTGLPSAKRTIDRDPLAGIRERTLANGLRVILMPLTSTPTADVRLVFGCDRANAAGYSRARSADFGAEPAVKARARARG